MGSFESFSDEEWESFIRMFAGDQDSDHISGHGFMFSSERDHGLNFDTPSHIPTSESNNANSLFIHDPSLCYDSDNINPSFYHYFSQESSDRYQFCPSNIIQLPTSNELDHELVDLCMTDENNNSSSLLAHGFSDYSMEEILCMAQDVVVEKGNMENSVCPMVAIADRSKRTAPKRKTEVPKLPNAVEDNPNNEKSNQSAKKRTRVSRDNKNKKNVQPKKNQTMMAATENGSDVDGEESSSNNNGGNAQTSSSCSSEHDLNTCQDSHGGAINLVNLKTRAGRGAATDPQSLYARKRRERINERLRILQNLVPNGTKVDISTMLEEAVHYVKFLQLQIKLLSSDDMWMYAPIAYNGMDMGLYHKISQTQ